MSRALLAAPHGGAKCTYMQLGFETNSIRREKPESVIRSRRTKKSYQVLMGNVVDAHTVIHPQAPERGRQAAGSCKNLNSERLSFDMLGRRSFQNGLWQRIRLGRAFKDVV